MIWGLVVSQPLFNAVAAHEGRYADAAVKLRVQER